MSPTSGSPGAPDQVPRPPDPECLACRDMQQQLARTGMVELRVVDGRLTARRPHAPTCLLGSSNQLHTMRLLARLREWAASFENQERK